MAKISTQSAKAKGRKLQQWVRDAIIGLFPQLTLDDVRSTSMGASGEDIQLSSAARKLFPYSVECKARAAFAIYAAYEQATTNAKTIEPLLIIRGDRKKPLAIMSADHFFKLLERNNEV